MSPEIGIILKACATSLTFVRFEAQVHVHMTFKVLLHMKPFPTLIAVILKLVCVLGFDVPLDILISRKPLSTNVTAIFLLLRVHCEYVSLKILLITLFPTIIAKFCSLVMKFEHVMLVFVRRQHFIANCAFLFF